MRITPAWAGKSAAALAPAGGRKDHPRVGGEKLSAAFQIITLPGSPPRGRGKAYSTEVGDVVPGSPPRGRGKVKAAAGHGLVMGITPAWAGKSTSESG